ncbi:MAG: glycosyltransferase family 87 protein [Thermoanaerobaculia bacterium]
MYSRALVEYAGSAAPGPMERVARTILALLFTLGFYPIVRGWWGGQVQTLLYGLFVLALWAWLAGRPALAGGLVGLICTVKPQLGLLAAWGLVRGERRFVAGLAGSAGAVSLVSLATYGWRDHVEYLRVLSFIGRHGESYAPNQSVNGLLHRLLHEGNNLHWVGDAFAPFDPWVYGLTLLTSLAFVAGALLWRRPRPGGERRSVGTLDLSVAVLSFTMASPVVWQHHYDVLLPLLAVALAAAVGAGRRWLVACVACAFVLVGTFTTLVDRFADTRWNVLQSYLFVGALIALGALYALRGEWSRRTRSERGSAAVAVSGPPRFR